MSFLKVCEIANKYQFVLEAEKTQVPSWVANGPLWIRAKKLLKKYWKKYEEPYGALVNLYRNMGGKKKKKKGNAADDDVFNADVPYED
jgi:hypothetical protein